MLLLPCAWPGGSPFQCGLLLGRCASRLAGGILRSPPVPGRLRPAGGKGGCRLGRSSLLAAKPLRPILPGPEVSVHHLVAVGIPSGWFHPPRRRGDRPCYDV